MVVWKRYIVPHGEPGDFHSQIVAVRRYTNISIRAKLKKDAQQQRKIQKNKIGMFRYSAVHGI